MQQDIQTCCSRLRCAGCTIWKVLSYIAYSLLEPRQTCRSTHGPLRMARDTAFQQHHSINRPLILHA